MSGSGDNLSFDTKLLYLFVLMFSWNPEEIVHVCRVQGIDKYIWLVGQVMSEPAVKKLVTVVEGGMDPSSYRESVVAEPLDQHAQASSQVILQHLLMPTFMIVLLVRKSIETLWENSAYIQRELLSLHKTCSILHVFVITIVAEQSDTVNHRWLLQLKLVCTCILMLNMGLMCICSYQTCLSPFQMWVKALLKDPGSLSRWSVGLLVLCSSSTTLVLMIVNQKVPAGWIPVLKVGSSYSQLVPSQKYGSEIGWQTTSSSANPNLEDTYFWLILCWCGVQFCVMQNIWMYQNLL